jgi:membrane protease YdiL (CAAX protease family)
MGSSMGLNFRNKQFLTFTAFEASLILISYLLVFLFDSREITYLPDTPTTELYIKLISSFVFVYVTAYIFAGPFSSKIPFLKGIRELIESSFLITFIRNAPWWQFLIVSLAAGFGEELLFRFFLQEKLGLILSSLVFGLCHALSLSYFLIATLMGAYLGWLYEWSGQVILVPILAHGAYDFFALIMYRRFNAGSEETSLS